MTKSYVSLDTKICPVCAKKHEVGLLLNKRLDKVFEKNTLTGMELCEECAKLEADGYVALVGIDRSKSTMSEPDRMSQNGAYRTGRLVHMKREAFERMTGNHTETIMWFVDDEVITRLEEMRNAQ